MWQRKVIAPDGRMWTVRRRWPWRVTAATQGAYFYAAGLTRSESRREFERATRQIGTGELDAELRGDQLQR